MPRGAYSEIMWRLVHRGTAGQKVMLDAALRTTTYIYHMLPWEYARLQLDAGALRLSPVTCWADPYEKWWCDLLFGRDDRLSGTQAYGQCWTTGRYDEPRWRMAAFGRIGPIVRVRCRVDAILHAGRDLISAHSGSLYVGRVRYRPQESLLRLAASVREGDQKDVTRMAARMLHYKRRAFAFEQEVRLIWLTKAKLEPAMFMDVSPGSINQIMTSPYASPVEHNEIRRVAEGFGIEALSSGILSVPSV